MWSIVDEHSMGGLFRPFNCLWIAYFYFIYIVSCYKTTALSCFAAETLVAKQVSGATFLCGSCSKHVSGVTYLYGSCSRHVSSASILGPQSSVGLVVNTCPVSGATFLYGSCRKHASGPTFLCGSCSKHVSGATFLYGSCRKHASGTTFLCGSCSKHVSGAELIPILSLRSQVHVLLMDNKH